MPGVITIELNGLRFFAGHGLYAEETKVANEFEVNLQLQYESNQKVITDIEDTIDYETVYSIIQEEMTIQQELLETCAMQICDLIYQEFRQIEIIKISIRKLTPPLTNFIGSVGVSYTKLYK